MGDRLLQRAAPFRVLRRSLDEGLQNRDALAFPDVNRAHLWGAGVWDASDDEPHQDPLQALKQDASRTVLRQAHLILVDEGVQKSVCRAACPPMSGLHLRVLCKSVAAPSAA